MPPPSASLDHTPLGEVYAGLQALHRKTDAFFAAVHSTHRARMRCGLGCASCCHRMPHVFPVEAWVIARELKRVPKEAAQRVLRTLQKVGAQEEVNPCPLLDRREHCQAYGLRPVICRSHGAPIKVPGRPASDFDVCPLNFAQPGMRGYVQPRDVLDIERLNEILAVVDGLFRQAYTTGDQLPLRLPLAQGILYFVRVED